METFNTEFTVKFSQCDRQEPGSLTGVCSGNALHPGGAAFRTLSLFIVIIRDMETGKTLR